MATRRSRRHGPAGVGVVVDPAVYRRIAYLLLSFPLGLAYFVFLSVALSLGAGLAVLGIGIPLLLGSLLAAGHLAAFERWRTRTLAGVEVGTPQTPERAGGLLTRTRLLLGSATTWRSVGGLLFTFGLGVAGFVVAVTLLTLSLAALTAPLTYDVSGFGIELVVWEPTTLVGALALVPVGAVLLVLALHVCDRLALAGGRVSASILGP